jgi:hypothetical protein
MAPDQPSWMTCIHATRGLCPECQTEYEEDPAAWIEFGMHTTGLVNWALEEQRQQQSWREQERQEQLIFESELNRLKANGDDDSATIPF